MSGFQAMVDMAKTPAEAKKDSMATASPPKPSVPTYPYGLCISLNEEDLAKLGMGDGDLPAIGDMIHLAAMAKVTSVSENQNTAEDGTVKKCCRIELQITHLATENEDEETARDEATEQRRGRFYGAIDGDAGGKEAA